MEEQSMKLRISDKIKEIDKFLEELSKIKPGTFEEYSTNFEKKAACERYAEKIPEALSDLSFLIVKHLKLQNPVDDKHVFKINLLKNT